LTKLYFSNNQIKELHPNIFANLVKLEVLSFSNNQIKELHPNIFANLVKLEVLSFPNNQIKELHPDIFANLGNLKTLYFSNNQIKELHPNIFANLGNLEQLYFSNNQIKELHPNIFANLGNLEQLYFSNNQIKELHPNIFANLVKLEYLEFQNNQIKELHPNIFEKLENLKRLAFGNNQIKELDSNIFASLKKLKVLHFNNNHIKMLDQCLLSNLINIKSIHFHGNNDKLQFFASSFCKLKSLSQLTAFDRFTILYPSFQPGTSKITSQSDLISKFAVKIFENLNSEIGIKNNFLFSLKLNSKSNLNDFQKLFEWTNIPNEISCIIGLNGAGKTSLLKCIDNSIDTNKSLKNSNFICKYYSSAQSSTDSDFDSEFKIAIKYNSSIADFCKIIYDFMNDFSLIQYLDFLLLSGHDHQQLNKFLDDLTGHKNKFTYRFDEKTCNQRKYTQKALFQSLKQDIRNEDRSGDAKGSIYKAYYDEIVKNGIEYYLEFPNKNENFKLSSGENLILLILLWKFHAQKLKEEYEENKNNDPITLKTRILLLDEPDAHMHPSLIEDFLSLLSSGDLLYLRMQVIITTHSPITVLLMAKKTKYLYLMSKSKHENSNENIYKIDFIKNKHQAIALLTEDLVSVKEPTRIVFVEANDDKLYYEFLQSFLMKKGFFPSQNNEFRLEFVAHGKHRVDNPEIEDSCRSMVEGLVSKCVNEKIKGGLIDSIFGIVDNDNKNSEPKQNIFYGQRYALENYIFDPINIFLYFQSKNQLNDFPPEIKNINLFELNDLNSTKDNIQRIVNYFAEKLEQESKKAVNNRKITSPVKSDNFILTKENGSNPKYNISIDVSSFKDSNSIHKTVEDIERELVEIFNQTQTKANSKHVKMDKNKDKNAKTLKEKDFLVKFCFDLQSKQYYEILYPRFLINLRGKNLVECYSTIFKNLDFPTILQMVEFISQLAHDHNYDRFIPAELIEVLSKIKYLDFEIASSKEFSITNKNLDNLIEYLETVKDDLKISQKIDLNEYQNTFENIRSYLDFRELNKSTLDKNEIKKSISTKIKNSNSSEEILKSIQNELAGKFNVLNEFKLKQESESSNNEVTDVIESNEDARRFLFQLLDFVDNKLAKNQEKAWINKLLDKLKTGSESLPNINEIEIFLDEIKNVCDDDNMNADEKIACLSEMVTETSNSLDLPDDGGISIFD
jgi:Leucine-rich repeat (LRR) protein